MKEYLSAFFRHPASSPAGRAAFLCLILVVGATTLYWQRFPALAGKPVESSPTTENKILLVPLDSRPPCRQFVIDLGKIADIKVIAPPSEAQDFYSQPGDTAKMRTWLEENVQNASAVILSADQLLFGGLLAAREQEYSEAEAASAINFIRELKNKFPHVPLYVFGILPRMEPPDTIDGYYDRRYIMEYSRLMGRKSAGLAVDEARISFLEANISPASLALYQARLKNNAAFNRRLMDLAERGVIEKLILGQDDGEPYSLPNREAVKLAAHAREKNLISRVIFCHGADEIAFDVLALIKAAKHRPKIFVKYADENTADLVMPYMAVTLRECVGEKIALVGGEVAPSPKEADFTLFVWAGDEKSRRKDGADYIARALERGEKVALVDLSRHFRADETLFPLLARQTAPINRLIAYSGWNSASNSVGTAIGQGAVFSTRLKETQGDERFALYAENIRFLENRFLEDYFYLKEVIDEVNAALKKAGYINTADLDLEKNYRCAKAMMQEAMKNRIKNHVASGAFRAPVPVETQEGAMRLYPAALQAEMYYPWPRTFEIFLETKMYFSR